MTVRRWIGTALAALLVLAATGCGARVAPEGIAQPDPGLAAAHDDAAASKPVDGTGAGDEPAGPAEAQAAQPQREDPESSPEPDARPSPDYGPRHNNGVVTITLSSTCVTRGTVMVVTLNGPPKAGVAAVVGYADNQAHGAMITGQSDGDGVFVWRFPVAPTVPNGAAKVLATSSGENWEGQGGTADAQFVVVNRLEECP